MHDVRPIALTCGDPSGIGPELAEAAWAVLRDETPFVWLGDPRHLPGSVPHETVTDPQGAIAIMPQALPVLPHQFAKAARAGAPTPENAAGVVDVLQKCVDLVQAGAVSALCTAPISKKELVEHAGFAYPGHTEFLAAASGAKRAVMMLAAEELRVIPATIHLPLSEVPSALTDDLLEDTLEIAHSSMIRDFGIAAPRIAVAGLNPHAGEGGLLGREDDALIRPVCDRLRAKGMAVTGPLPADTMFHAPARAAYDVAVAMYHDQALIPIKTLAFDRGVNVTLGLP
ncbi:MAG: 4-hydroxythreonine-4-phosphate dehydrogenase PdxA, partial [Pseudomonadota bacterium]